MKIKSGNWHLKIISILMAFLLWLFITNENIVFKTKEVPGVKLNVINLDPGFTAVFPQEIRVSIVGTPRGASEIYAYIDMKDKGAGEFEMPVKVKPMPGTRVVDITPGQVKVEVSEVQQHIFPVGYVVEKGPPAGFEVAGVEIVPSRCVVRGGQGEANRVARLAVFLDLSQVEEAAGFTLSPVPLDSRDRPLTSSLDVMPGQVQAYVVLSHKQEMARVDVLPNLTGSLAEGYAVERVTVVPDTVAVMGTEEATKGLTSVTTEPIDLGGRDRFYRVEVALVAPEGVKLYPQRVTVMIEVKNVGAKTEPAGDKTSARTAR